MKRCFVRRTGNNILFSKGPHRKPFQHKSLMNEEYVNGGATQKTPEQRKSEFKRWLALFFIKRGHYKLTKKAYEELGENTPRQSIHIGETVCQRDRESSQIITREPTAAERRETVRIKVARMLTEQREKELYDQGYIDRPYHLSWKSEEVRIAVIRGLIEILDKNPREIERKDFRENRLDGLLAIYYRNSPYLALVEAGYAYSMDELREHSKNIEFKTEKIYPWEMKYSPGIYDEKENRVAATRWLLWKTGKGARDIGKDDFVNNGLGGLLNQYSASPYLALVEAGYAYSKEEYLEHARTGEFKTEKIYPWEMKVAPYIYDGKENRVAAAKWLLWKTGKEAGEIKHDDFYVNGLVGLLEKRDTCRGVLLDAGLITDS